MAQSQIVKKKRGVKYLLEIFKEHIGEENGISMRELFIAYYGVRPEFYNPFELYYKTTLLQRALNYLRKNTNAFVVFKEEHYFVVTNRQEATEYVARLNNTKAKIDFMLRRLDEAIKKKFYEKLESEQD